MQNETEKKKKNTKGEGGGTEAKTRVMLLLPEDMLVHIWEYLNVQEICRIECSARGFRSSSTAITLWASILLISRRHWRPPPPPLGLPLPDLPDDAELEEKGQVSIRIDARGALGVSQSLLLLHNSDLLLDPKTRSSVAEEEEEDYEEKKKKHPKEMVKKIKARKQKKRAALTKDASRAKWTWCLEVFSSWPLISVVVAALYTTLILVSISLIQLDTIRHWTIIPLLFLLLFLFLLVLLYVLARFNKCFFSVRHFRFHPGCLSVLTNEIEAGSTPRLQFLLLSFLFLAVGGMIVAAFLGSWTMFQFSFWSFAILLIFFGSCLPFVLDRTRACPLTSEWCNTFSWLVFLGLPSLCTVIISLEILFVAQAERLVRVALFSLLGKHAIIAIYLVINGWSRGGVGRNMFLLGCVLLTLALSTECLGVAAILDVLFGTTRTLAATLVAVLAGLLFPFMTCLIILPWHWYNLPENDSLWFTTRCRPPNPITI